MKAIVKENDVAAKPIPKDKDTRPIDNPHPIFLGADCDNYHHLLEDV